MGGAEFVAHEEALELKKRGNNVQVFAGRLIAEHTIRSVSLETYESIPVIRVTNFHTDFNPNTQSLIDHEIDGFFTETLSKFKPDIIHFHNLNGLSYRLPIIAKEFGVSVVMTLHDYWGLCLRNTLLNINGGVCENLESCRTCLPLANDDHAANIPMRIRKSYIRYMLSYVDCFISPSNYLAARYQEIFPIKERMHVLKNGINHLKYLEKGEDSFAANSLNIKILFVGHIGDHKGIKVLLDSLLLLKSKNYTLEVIGDGPLSIVLNDFISDQKARNNVSFKGVIQNKEMPYFYHRSDILVLPSIWNENQPVCLMEAMSCGLPVIASKIGGIPEIVRDGWNGLLFKAGDAIDLSRCLDELISTESLRRRLGKNGVFFARMNNIKNHTDKLLSIYKKVTLALVVPKSKNLVALFGRFSFYSLTKVEQKYLDDVESRHDFIIPKDWLGRSERSLVSRKWKLNNYSGIKNLINWILY
jgi:glycosyltransferase involved in cell wall biosynthesis